MRVSTKHDGPRISFNLQLDAEDSVRGRGQQGKEIELVTGNASVQFERPVEPPHPDLVGLAALTVLRPWIQRRLTLSQGVSPTFANAVHEAMAIEIGPSDADLSPRRPGEDLGLMYSGGPDCMAAELLLGRQLPLFHFRRVKHPRVPNRTRMRSDVQEALVRKAAERGRVLHVTRSDLEFICRPFPTFPFWGALTIGAILMADVTDLGGVVSGRNISGIYLGWGKGFRPQGEQETEWRRVYAAAGLELIQPLAGASDVVSKRLASSHRFFDLARSCLVGTLDMPCYRCPKCLTTEVMAAAINGRPLSQKVNASFETSEEIRQRFRRLPPYPNQHLLEYSIPRVPQIDRTVLAEAAAALAPSKEETLWVERFYGPALGPNVPHTLISEVKRRLTEQVTFMTPVEESQVENWTPISR